jgi:signal transduction histidine kinase
MSILENKPRSATATALTPVHLLKISTSQFAEYLASQPHSLVSMMKTLSKRIRKDTELISAEFQKANILIHDMKNRLTAFLLLNLFKDAALSAKSKRYLELMRHSYADLAGMMDEALANAKRQTFVRLGEETSIKDLIDELLHTEFILHEALQGKNIRAEIPPDLPKLPVPQNDLRRVLTNLVINAGQASQVGSEIYIQATHQDKEVTLSVTDKGCGIPAELYLKIFEPNFTTKSDGNGLGLASCRDIIENRHKGRLSFESSDSGTTFSFSLPLPGNAEDICR